VKKKKKDYNNRMRTKETLKARKDKINLVIQKFDIREIMDESGEVENDTIIQISFEGILINLSIAAAIRLAIELNKTLNIR
jgi:hypothetical protein